MQKSRQRWLRTFVEDRGILMGVKTNSFMIRNLWSGAALKRLLSVALFIGFVVLVEHYFGWVQLLTPWQTLSAGQILAAAGLAFVSYWTRAMRLYDYFRPPRMAEVPKMQEQFSGRPPRMAVASGILPPATLVHPCTAEVPETHDSMDGGGRALPGANAEEQLSGRQDMRGAFGSCFKVTLQHNLLQRRFFSHD